MSEKALRKYFGKLIVGHVVQIESHATAVGVPDTNICSFGREHWLELKFTSGSKPFKVRPAQKTWFKRRERAGARNLWILWRHDIDGIARHGIVHMAGDKIEDVFSNSCPSFWSAASVSTWGPRIDVDELNTILGMSRNEGNTNE